MEALGIRRANCRSINRSIHLTSPTPRRAAHLQHSIPFVHVLLASVSALGRYLGRGETETAIKGAFDAGPSHARWSAELRKVL
jgi:hypothetical protein